MIAFWQKFLGSSSKVGDYILIFRSHSHSIDLLGSSLESRAIGTLIPQIAYDGKALRDMVLRVLRRMIQDR